MGWRDGRGVGVDEPARNEAARGREGLRGQDDGKKWVAGRVVLGLFENAGGNAVRNDMRTRRQVGKGAGALMADVHEQDPQAARRVLFDVHVGGAREVYLAGTFNGWETTTLPMVHTGTGRWEKELLLPPGRYEYLLIADGRWMEDPRCDEKCTNPFGGMNCVRRVG